jgi:hypothetical protein
VDFTVYEVALKEGFSSSILVSRFHSYLTLLCTWHLWQHYKGTVSPHTLGSVRRLFYLIRRHVRTASPLNFRRNYLQNTCVVTWPCLFWRGTAKPKWRHNTSDDTAESMCFGSLVKLPYRPTCNLQRNITPELQRWDVVDWQGTGTCDEVLCRR